MSEATDSFHINATIMNIKNDKKSVVSHNQTEMQIIARTGRQLRLIWPATIRGKSGLHTTWSS